MKYLSLLMILSAVVVEAKTTYPFTEEHWAFQTQAHEIAAYQGQQAIKIDRGLATLKDFEFLNGTVEFDVYMLPEQSFPGLRFRALNEYQMESFFLRPHLSGKPDANQAAPVVGGLTAFQLYFGPTYSFPYNYRFDGWTHIKLVVNGDKAQVFLDHAEKPHLSWYLKHKPEAGSLAIGGSAAPAHYANFTVDTNATELIDFNAKPVPHLDGAVKRWQVSDKFLEKDLANLGGLKGLIDQRQWPHWIEEEERGIAHIAWKVNRYGSEGDTVFARIDIESEKDQSKIFNFGYSDRAVVILNGQPLYKGTKKWRSRDYRYLGTVGFHDSVYLPLKRGKNSLILAVSEDFGGWLVAGQFENYDDIKILLSND